MQTPPLAHARQANGARADEPFGEEPRLPRSPDPFGGGALYGLWRGSLEDRRETCPTSTAGADR